MKKSIITPSMMCVDAYSLAESISVFEETEVEYLHIDVMDGEFVPNYALSSDYCRQLRKHCTIPLDIHLMIDHPENKLTWFDFRPGDMVSIHWEASRHLQRMLSYLKGLGVLPVVAVNPATPAELLQDILDDISGILIMSVNPGFSGQKMVPASLDKIRRTRRWLDTLGYEQIDIEVDGNVSYENAHLMRDAGANIFVAGTASIFSNGSVSADRIQLLRNAIQ